VSSEEPRPLRLTVYTDASVWGGAERALGTLIAALRPGIDVTVLGVERAVVERIATFRSGSATRIVPPVAHKGDLGPILAHIRAVRALRPEVFHANLATTFACQYGILAGLLARVPVVAVEKSPIPGTSPLQLRFKRLLSRRLAAHVSVGERSAREVEAVVGLPAGRVRTIYNGAVDRGRREPGETSTRLVVGALGRLSPEKGFDVLVRALALLPEAHAIVLGDGPERPALEALARELGVADRLELAGWDDDAQLRLPSFDVLVLPSRFEAFPAAVVEAMLAGLPVVATDVGSVAEAIVDGETGLVVAPDDPGALAAALGRVLADPALRASFGAAGRARAQALFSAAAMARAFEALYEEIRR
jgi:glycosyltransferase involved in cell wall biosynthesis